MQYIHVPLHTYIHTYCGPWYVGYLLLVWLWVSCLLMQTVLLVTTHACTGLHHSWHKHAEADIHTHNHVHTYTMYYSYSVNIPLREELFFKSGKCSCNNWIIHTYLAVHFAMHFWQHKIECFSNSTVLVLCHFICMVAWMIWLPYVYATIHTILLGSVLVHMHYVVCTLNSSLMHLYGSNPSLIVDVKLLLVMAYNYKPLSWSGDYDTCDVYGACTNNKVLLWGDEMTAYEKQAMWMCVYVRTCTHL
jgi:hypothetical protein